MKYFRANLNCYRYSKGEILHNRRMNDHDRDAASSTEIKTLIVKVKESG